MLDRTRQQRAPYFFITAIWTKYKLACWNINLRYINCLGTAPELRNIWLLMYLLCALYCEVRLEQKHIDWPWQLSRRGNRTFIVMAAMRWKYRWLHIPRCIIGYKRLATGWKDRGSNPVGRRDFAHPFRPALETTQPLLQRIPGLSRGESGRGVAWRWSPTPHLAPRLKNE